MKKYKAFQYVKGTKERDKLGLSVTGESLKLALILESHNRGVKLQIIDHTESVYIGTIICTYDDYLELIDNSMCDLLC